MKTKGDKVLLIIMSLEDVLPRVYLRCESILMLYFSPLSPSQLIYCYRILLTIKFLLSYIKFSDLNEFSPSGTPLYLVLGIFH